MQYHLQVFEYEDRRQFRIFDIHGEPWFVLADVCRALGIRNASEMNGHVLAERSPDGTEIRIDVSVGKRFSEWLKAEHPDIADDYSFYVHWTPEWEGPVRQYPNRMLPLFIEFVETVWIPKYGPAYISPRDPAALPYLHKIIPALDRPKAGMIRLPNARQRL